MAQTNNAILEKYCYSDLDANCTTYGALYQWDEAMQYVVTAGAQGICPANSHIPTDAEWKTLEMYLGMSQAQADAIGWRGTNQGAQLILGGTSGLNLPLAGYRGSTGLFYMPSNTFLWSSSELSGIVAWDRRVASGLDTAYRYDTDQKVNGFSVRCIGN